MSRPTPDQVLLALYAAVEDQIWVQGLSDFELEAHIEVAVASHDSDTVRLVNAEMARRGEQYMIAAGIEIY